MVYLLKVIIMILLLLALLLLSLLKVRNTTLVAGNGLTYLTLPIKHKIFIVIQKQKSLKNFFFFYREKEISKKCLYFYHEIVISKSFLYNLQAEILTHSLGQRQNFLYFPRISNFSNQKLFTSVWKSRFFTRRKNLW